MNRCREVKNLLALRPADLSFEEQRQVQIHLAACADCTVLAQVYAEQDRLIGHTPRVRLTPSQRSHLFSQIQSKRRQQTMITKLSLVVSGVIAIVIFILMGLCTRSLMNFDQSDTEVLSAQPSGGEEAPMHAPETTPSVLEVTVTPVVAPTLVWPVNGHITQFYSEKHPALDIAAREGTPVVAATIGIIISVGWNEVDGHNVVIEHKNGLQTRYTHLLDSSVEPDEMVGKGQVIGRVGSTGQSTGPHLHFELIQDGERLNPLPFLE